MVGEELHAQTDLPGSPVVGGLDPDLFREGEALDVDGDLGRVGLESVREIRVVTSLIERGDGKLLLLRRSDQVGSFRGRWAGVSGFLEDPTEEAQARREILEETQIPSVDLDLVARGRTVYARDEDRIYAAAPFRFHTRSTDVRLDWEHTEYRWIDPEELGRFPTVPKLDRVWKAVSSPSV